MEGERTKWAQLEQQLWQAYQLSLALPWFYTTFTKKTDSKLSEVITAFLYLIENHQP